MSSNDDLKARLLRIVQDLGEHCESVRIFVTVQNGGGETAAMDFGSGNFYAQLGQIQEWIAIQDQYQRNWATRHDLKDDDNDSPVSDA